MIKNILATIGLGIGSTLLFNNRANAQMSWPATGQWSVYLPYTTTIDMDNDGTTFYCISRSSFFTYNKSDGSLQGYTKANGMSDAGMAAVGYDTYTGKTLIAYSNGNLDIFKDGFFENVPDILISTAIADKTINHIQCYGGNAYVSTVFGLVIVDLNRREIKQTIPFYEGQNLANIYQSTTDGTNIYVATSNGIFKTSLNSGTMFNYSTWNRLSTSMATHIQYANNNFWVANADSLSKIDGNTISFLKQFSQNILSINKTQNDALWVSLAPTTNKSGYAIKLENNNTIDSIPNLYIKEIADLGDGYQWVIDEYSGLRRRENTNNEFTNIAPSGPASDGAYNVWAYDGNFYLAHGAYRLTSWNVVGNQDFFSKFSNGAFTTYKWDVLNLVPNTNFIGDCINLTSNPKTNETYFALYYGGLIKLDANNQLTLYKSGYLDHNNEGDTASYRVTDMAFDRDNNLWITQSTVDNVLRVKTPDNQWYKYRVGSVKHGSNIIIDDYNQKWFIAGKQNGGIAVFSDNGTLNNSADDRYINVSTSQGLPSNNVLSLAKSPADGSIWVGTDNGVVVFNCPGEIMNGNCAAYKKPLVAEGYNFANYLFEGISVRSIAIDAGNSKWIGTNAGVFLLDADAENILAQFNQSNSPLLSNEIISIDIDPIKGTVFFSTDKGLCAYGGGANDANTSAFSEPLLVYPNPVPSGFNGTIAVKGLMANSDIRITDVAGQLVYKGRSNGGMFTWDGYDYTGHKAQSGVYLIFAVSKDGTQKQTGKFIIHQ